MLRYMTAGESHGRCLTVILDGVPAGLELKKKDIDRDLQRRQKGYGRGDRMKSIEKDRVEIDSGVRLGQTIGSPITLRIDNLDWKNWRFIMSVDALSSGEKILTRPRPGHADLTGILKYDRKDIRDVLERASARETASRVAAGAVCRRLLEEFGIKITSCVKEIGGVRGRIPVMGIEKLGRICDGSELRCPDVKAEKIMKQLIALARKKGDTLGGIFTVIAAGVPPGLGSYSQWDRRLDGLLARAVMSIQAVKGVEIGTGFSLSSLPGSCAHDQIFFDKKKGFFRRTNNAGGMEGGMSNGQDIVVNAVMKPIPSLVNPLLSVDIKTKKPFKASVVRSDICAVPSASVIGEAVVAFELACAMKAKFGGDSVAEMKRNFGAYMQRIRKI